jgi:5'-phosphate synthase pdxT subunit
MARVGVLALQGDVREHIRSFSDCGSEAFPVKTLGELDSCQALVIPGGESTTIAKLARNFGLLEPMRERILSGLPVYGSCAGMILLADRVIDGIADQETLGGLDITVRRNAFGRQVDSFESEVTFAAERPFNFTAVFIRAPWVEETGPDVEILAKVDGHPVAVRSKNLFATSFHPELTSDNRIHRFFLDEIVREATEPVSR